MSVGSAACLLAVENVKGDCLQSETIVGIKGQTLEKLGGADCHGSRHCYYRLVSNLFLAFGQWLYLGEMENKDFVHQF